MATKKTKLFNFEGLTLDARRDTVDFRDKIYVPTLIEVPPRSSLEDYQGFKVPVLNQGQEGACTGFGLATVAHYLLRRRRVSPDETPVSPRMFYEMAKRYDEWPGEGYSGSSARGAMKGWHKHGVCQETLWPYKVNQADPNLTNERAGDAMNRPLGAYFRVNHKDLVAMHSAIAEVGILYATGNVHEGWGSLDAQGRIPYDENTKIRGGHAFAIVAYDEAGFWIQNSWGPGWGKQGFAKLSYDDWLANGMDVWVARLGVPVQFQTRQGQAAALSPGARTSQGYAYAEMRPHIISLGNNGELSSVGIYATSANDMKSIFTEDIPRITKDWKRKRLLLYAHGGLVSEASFIQRVAEYRAPLLKAEIYPIAFTWNTDFISTLKNILQDAVQHRRPEGVLDKALDFMLDRLDDTLEPLARILGGKVQWDEMKENARLATANPRGGARLAASYVEKLLGGDGGYEVHLAGHSAGSIFMGPLLQYLATPGRIAHGRMKGRKGLGLRVASCTLWAPGISIAEFKETYLPVMRAGGLGRFALYTLTDEAEQDDNCANIYNKSLLYLVANALEEKRYTPLLGMEKYVNRDPELVELFQDPESAAWVKTPNDAPPDTPWASKARSHGSFTDDTPTLVSTLSRIQTPREKTPSFALASSDTAMRDRRMQINQATRGS
jgi:hypothetical protein